MHNLRLHGDGIAECASCGTIYRLVECQSQGARREGFDCFMCGERMDSMIGNGRRAYELVSSPQISRLMEV